MNALFNPRIAIDGIGIRTDAHGRFCLNDLHQASGSEVKNKPSNFLQNDKTQALVQELADDGFPSSAQIQPVSVIRGGLEQGTYVVKELVYSYAMWISAAFNLKVIRTFDSLSMKQAITLPDFTNPAAAARAWACEFEAKQLAEQQIAVLAPKAEALEKIAETSHTYCLRECAKTIGIKESELIQLLNRTSPVIKNQYDGKERVFLHMRVTAFGLTRITGLVNKFKKERNAT